MEARKALQESQSIHDRSYVAELVQKWSPLLQGIKVEHTRNVMAVLYENQAQYLMNLNEETRSTNVGSFLKFVFPVLRRVWPNLIANEIVSIQPMTAPVGGVFFYDLKYGTTKGKVTAGDTLIRDFNRYYSSEKIDEEIIGVGPGTSYSSTLDFTPVRTGTVYVFGHKATGGDLVSGVDNGSGIILGTGVSGNVDYDDGSITLEFTDSISGNVTATYEYNSECNSNVPQVNIDIQLLEIRATTRKLKALWCSEAADDLKAFHGIDAEAEIVAGIAAEIALELDREIIEDLHAQATGFSGTFAASPVPAYHTQVDHYRNIITEITRGSNRIHKNSLRGPANFLVTSPDVSSLIEQLETHGDFRPVVAAPNSDTLAPVEAPHTFGVYKVGTLSSKYVLYKDPFFTVNGTPGSGSANGDILLGYKGNTFIDAGYVWAPYVPLQVTATFLDPDDFQFRKGMRTRYAKRMVRSEFYGVVTVTGL